MQVVEYSSLPNTKEVMYISTITKVIGEIKRREMYFKEFRDWLKEQILWDKEAWPVVWSLLDIKVGEKIHLGEFAEQLHAADDESTLKELLFKRLLKRNEILAKYVFEALDERLHSTHELYRLITSYVYPGEYITLVNFQHWIKWMNAIGYIKFIGIRWGISETGRGEMQRISMIDVEDVLEDERIEQAAAKEREEASTPEPEPVRAVVEAAAPVAAPVADAPDEPISASGPRVEEVRPQAVAPAPRVESAPAPVQRSAPPAPAPRPAVEAVPIPRMQPKRYVLPEISSDDLMENARKIKSWWSNYADKKTYQVTDFGLNAAEHGKDKNRFLFKLFCLGKLTMYEDFSPVFYPYVEELMKRRVLDRLWAEESVGMLFGENDFFKGNPWFLKASENLVYFLMFRHRLKSDDGLADKLEEARTGRELIGLLSEKIYGSALTVEPFWVAREMVRMGLWDNPAFETITVVPTYQVRMNMFRLGFLDSMYVDSFAQLVDATERLSRYFGPEDNFEAPLALFHQGQKCQFSCGRTNVCEFACREKFNV